VAFVYDRVRQSYDRVAERYADEFSGELAAKPVDRALLGCLAELAADLVRDTGPGTVGDLGCGPGHVAAHLTGLGADAVGIDISPTMVEVGQARFPKVQFRVGSLLALPATDGEFAAAAAFYSIIHLRPDDRPAAYLEMARAIRSGGWLLVAFHVSQVGGAPGEIMHAEEWWGESVDLEFHYLDPDEVASGLAAAEFTLTARLDREPGPGGEHQSRRCYLLARRA
jgi:SAM-dependent methyltransferase